MSLVPDPVAYVETLELAEPSAQLRRLVEEGRPEGAAIAPDDNQPSADVDNGSLVSFVAGVSLEHRSDALNSTLLAQLNSDVMFDRFNPDQVVDWYKNYATVLGRVGWVMQNFQFQNYQASGSTFTINAAIVQIVSSFLSANEVAVVRATLDALKDLGTDTPWYKVWDETSHDANGGNFQIASANDDTGSGPLVMGYSAYSFTTTETTTRFLWADYNSSSTDLHFATQTATLNEDVYGKVRQAIIDKLGDRAAMYIIDLPIG